MPEDADVSVAVVGSGFSGIGLAIRLVRAGFENLTVFERADDLGGVWRDNTYPGAACDAPSHLYSYSFEPNPDWSTRFATQPEILDYLRRCAERTGVVDHIRFGAEVEAAAFDEAAGRWVITTADGRTTTADLLVAACGQLSRPAVPAIPGLASFEGTVFHSAGWDHAHDLAGRRVAVVGNGASAVQFVPEIAPVVGELHVFQRTPQWVGPKSDRRYPEWRRRLNRRVPATQAAARLGVYLLFEVLLNPMLVSRRGRRLLGAHVRAMCWASRRTVRDADTRARLTPGYELGCKRVLMSNDYYRSLQAPNVHLHAEEVVAVTPTGVVATGGTEHPVDTLILATGFRSHAFVAPMRVTGLAGRQLADAWAPGASTYLGLSVTGFPNFFMMYGPNTNLGAGSIVHVLESQMRHIVEAARILRAHRPAYLEVRPQAMAAADTATQRRLRTTVWNQGGCTSWYREASGRNSSNWPGSMLEYRLRTRRVRLDHYRLVAPGPATAGAVP